jgi:hypothetical protein
VSRDDNVLNTRPKKDAKIKPAFVKTVSHSAIAAGDGPGFVKNSAIPVAPKVPSGDNVPIAPKGIFAPPPRPKDAPLAPEGIKPPTAPPPKAPALSEIPKHGDEGAHVDIERETIKTIVPKIKSVGILPLIMKGIHTIAGSVVVLVDYAVSFFSYTPITKIVQEPHYSFDSSETCLFTLSILSRLSRAELVVSF